MYNNYSIESFINYLNEEDNIATEGIKEIFFKAWEFIKRQFKKLWNFITQTIPLKFKSFLDKHPKFRNLPGIKQLYAKLKKLESKTKNTGNKIKKNERSRDNNNEIVNEVKKEIQEETKEAKEIVEEFKTIVEGGGSDYQNIAYTATKDDVDEVNKKIEEDDLGVGDKEIKYRADIKDIKRLRYIFLDSLDVDPTFEDYRWGYNYALKHAYFFEPHKEMTPFSKNPKDWNIDYWVKIKIDFHHNWSQKRFEYMIKIAPIVYSEKVKRIREEEANLKK